MLRDQKRLQVLEDEAGEVEQRFATQAPIPKPPFWGGYRVEPEEIEFWHAQPSRMHERLRFRRQGDHWVSELLSP